MAVLTTPRASPLRHWSGWLPIAIPVFLFSLGVRSVVVNGFVPQAPRQALPVLALQLFATVALFAALYWAEHTASAA